MINEKKEYSKKTETDHWVELPSEVPEEYFRLADKLEEAAAKLRRGDIVEAEKQTRKTAVQVSTILACLKT